MAIPATGHIGLAAAATIVAAVAVLPPPALAAGGGTTLEMNGPAAKALAAQGVQIVPLKPAKGRQKRVALPVAAGLAGTATTLLRHRGAISLRAPSGETLRIGKLSLLLDEHSRVEAELDGKDTDLFRVLKGGRREVDPAGGTVALAALRLKLTRGAARTIATRLGLAQLKPRRFGTLSANASGLVGTGPPEPPPPPSSECPLPSNAGPAPENPLSAMVRPAGATDITVATIDWHVRESFIRYIDTGEGTSVSGGATADPPVLLPGASAALSYDFRFPFSGGWLDTGADPANPADDSAHVRFAGAVRFRYSGHKIDLSAANPEIEIAGARSRAIFSISDSGATPQPQVLINLDLSRAAAIVATGNTFTYERVPGVIPSGTASTTFAGFYAPGTEFGCVTVSLSTG